MSDLRLPYFIPLPYHLQSQGTCPVACRPVILALRKPTLSYSDHCSGKNFKRTKPSMAAPLTATQIPCCECGTPIFPNAANLCSTCLAQEFNLAEVVQRGPGGAHQITVFQCRKCRRYQRTEKHYEYATPESPQLLTICLKHIPALSDPNIHLVDAGWIWTEPHSMRLKVRLTIRTELQSVMVQQRVMVELHVQFKMCPECNREYTNRTWHALVQLRQRRSDDAPKKGLAALEMAIAKNKDIRKHVLRIDNCKNGFDFYFLSQHHAQAFTAFLQRVAPMRVKTSQKLVSADVKNNTANMKYTTTCDMVPLCRDDLTLIHKSAKGKLAGRLALVTKVSSSIRLMDASPKRQNIESSQMDLSADAYNKNEKLYSVLQASHRLTRFIVLDVELCDKAHGLLEVENVLYQGPQSGVEKYALADVQLARESDFGVNDDTFSCVSHLGNLLSPGDVVLGYDLVSTVGGDWELKESFNSSFVIPDVVLVKKVHGTEPAPADEPQKHTTKKRERRKRRKEGKRMKELEESAIRMGFFEDEDDNHSNFDEVLSKDPELAAELSVLERDLAALDTSSPNEDAEHGGDDDEEHE